MNSQISSQSSVESDTVSSKYFCDLQISVNHSGCSLKNQTKGMSFSYWFIIYLSAKIKWSFLKI